MFVGLFGVKSLFWTGLKFIINYSHNILIITVTIDALMTIRLSFIPIER